MGSVYAGVHEQTGERAAIKVLAEALSTDARFRARFQGEVETLKKLRHEHIVTLRGYGEAEGQMFFVMELVDGQSLETELRDGRRFTWREVVDIAVQICAALKHAHDHGVIHRDLKPANLLRTPESKVKLTDFGIAKFFGSSGLTTAGSMIGTPDYMAPEQAEGRLVTPRTDLYSLGSVMYALLTGKPPFVSPTVLQVIERVRFEEPRPLRLVTPQIPEALDEIVSQLLRKNPNERIATPQALSNLLQAMRHALATAAPTVATPPSRPESVGVTAEFIPQVTGATQSPSQPLPPGERPTIDFPPDQPLRLQPVLPAPQRITVEPLAATEASAKAAFDVEPPAARPTAPRDHFTPVTEEDWRRERTQMEPRARSRRDMLITGGMAALLLGILIAFVIAFWPPTSASRPWRPRDNCRTTMKPRSIPFCRGSLPIPGPRTSRTCDSSTCA
jgi:serine/threonine-protein kinase